MCLQLLACWDSGFESGLGQGCLSVASVVSYKSLRQADHSSGGVPPSVVCLSSKPRLCVNPGPLGAVEPREKNTLISKSVRISWNYRLHSVVVAIWKIFDT